MQLTHERLLANRGFYGFDGLCHLRIHQRAGELPVVIAAELDDNPGTSVTDAIEMVAYAITQEALPDGREFRLIEHHPAGGARDEPTFELVSFEHRTPITPKHRRAAQHLTAFSGDFCDPRWQPVGDITEVLGSTPRSWPAGRHTARAIAGEQAEQLRAALAERSAEARRWLLSLLEEPDHREEDMASRTQRRAAGAPHSTTESHAKVVDIHRGGCWNRVYAPTRRWPFWREQDGTRLAYPTVIAHAGARRAEVRELHADAIVDLVSRAQAVDEQGDRPAARRLAAAAARLAGEVVGLWPAP
jgi:hypothetical protein